MLGAHDVIGPAIGLAGDDRHLGHRRLAEGVEQFCPVLDDPVEFLVRPGEEAGHVDEGDDGNIEAIAEAHEARALNRRVYIECSCKHRGLVRNNPH